MLACTGVSTPFCWTAAAETDVSAQMRTLCILSLPTVVPSGRRGLPPIITAMVEHIETIAEEDVRLPCDKYVRLDIEP